MKNRKSVKNGKISSSLNNVTIVPEEEEQKIYLKEKQYKLTILLKL